MTVIAPIKAFRFPMAKVEKAMPLERLPPFVKADYAVGLELDAMLKGEVYAANALRHTFKSVPYGLEGDFIFECSDGNYAAPYRKEVLARYSLLVRGYIEDYPEATSIPLLTENRRAVRSIFSTLLNGDYAILEGDVLSALRMLTPPTDLFYLFFALPKSFPSSLLLSIIEGITEEERAGILRGHQLESNLDVAIHWNELNEDPPRELPNAGRGLAIAYRFHYVRDYLRTTYVPLLHDPYPSHRAIELLTSVKKEQARDEEALRFILTTTFDDDSGILSEKEESDLAGSMLLLAIKSSWKDFCFILGMLAVREPFLGNENVEKMAPYQLRVVQGTIASHWYCSVHVVIFEKYEENMVHFDNLVVPYFVL